MKAVLSFETWKVMGAVDMHKHMQAHNSSVKFGSGVFDFKKWAIQILHNTSRGRTGSVV